MVSVSTIRRRLLAAALLEPAPKKRPKNSFVRFETALPNETWQSDFTHIWLADGSDPETISSLDDHPRYALYVSCHQRITGDTVVDTYNHRRIHTAIGKVPPAIAYHRLPKGEPGNDGAKNHYQMHPISLIRHLTLNPNIGYQPRYKNAKTPEPGVRGFPMS